MVFIIFLLPCWASPQLDWNFSYIGVSFWKKIEHYTEVQNILINVYDDWLTLTFAHDERLFLS